MASLLSNFDYSNQIRIFLSLFATVISLVFPVVLSRINSGKWGLKDAFLGKMAPNWLVAVLVFIIALLLQLYLFVASKQVPVLSAETQNSTVIQPSNKVPVVWKRLIDNAFEWDLTEMDRSSEGGFCPRIYKNNFNYRSIWLRQQIPVVFPKIQLRFQVKKKTGDNKASKMLIQFGDVYGKKYKVANFYLPFDLTTGVNFEAYDLKSIGLSFQDNPGVLPLTIKPDSVVTMEVSTTNVLDNTVTYQYHLDYFPDGQTVSIPMDFQYLVKLPDPSPKQLLMNFGIGVFENSCLEGVEYSVSN